MNIYSKSGTKVTFLNKNGNDWQRAVANKIFKVGQIYTVKSIDVHSCVSYVEFEEFPEKTFNSVMFDDIKLT